MNDLAPMKNCPGGGCKVGQISSRGNIFTIFSIEMQGQPKLALP